MDDIKQGENPIKNVYLFLLLSTGVSNLDLSVLELYCSMNCVGLPTSRSALALTFAVGNEVRGPLTHRR